MQEIFFRTQIQMEKSLYNFKEVSHFQMISVLSRYIEIEKVDFEVSKSETFNTVKYRRE